MTPSFHFAGCRRVDFGGTNNRWMVVDTMPSDEARLHTALDICEKLADHIWLLDPEDEILKDYISSTPTAEAPVAGSPTAVRPIVQIEKLSRNADMDQVIDRLNVLIREHNNELE